MSFRSTLYKWHQKKKILCLFFNSLFIQYRISKIELFNTLDQILLVGPGSLSISLVTACFVGFVFTLQVAKEFLYFDAASLIGAVLTIAFIRELSPVLTSVIIIGRIGSCFTAELATMKVTEQIDALYLLDTNPVIYLVLPRVLASIVMLPMLNIFSFSTSLASSAFICFILYGIDPVLFFLSSFSALSFSDIINSLLKTIVFALAISMISCSWGLKAKGGAKGVGQSTTSSVVTCLLTVFILDFILSYIMFSNLESSIKIL
uniref:mlaE family lipid ABC transporter permease subunit n=1 Tax=Pachymeniopsis lanceolata TaxID=151733 RepID=UPI002A808C1A|nr:mlaE family lipid ABC transporter permease subunit [Pachymeniopsis lanceolata]WOL37171.1 mlaE family lipid ABC transporter permease subunit [Pachymeniopsis lanceolata]